MTYRVEVEEAFLKQVNKVFQKHPDLRTPFQRLVTDMREDPFQSKLRLYPLYGEFAGSYAVSLTFSYRVTLTLQITERTIILLDIGSHDEVYR